MKAGHTGQPPQCSVTDFFSKKHSTSHFSVISHVWYNNSSHRLQMKSLKKYIQNLFSRWAGGIHSSFPLPSVRDGILVTSVWYLLIWSNAKETKLKILGKKILLWHWNLVTFHFVPKIIHAHIIYIINVYYIYMLIYCINKYIYMYC